MTTESAFLSAIRAQPADDAVRLVYADWLQENGEEVRAELIRVQIELARPTPVQPATMSYSLVSSEEHVRQVLEFRTATARRAALDRRERELLSTLRVPVPPGWSIGIGLGSTARGARGDLFFRRGLAERAVCSGAVWIADGDAILRIHPVERVRLTSVPRTRAGSDGIELEGDPLGKCFARSEVEAALRAGPPTRDPTGAIVALRLRFGEQPIFEVTNGGV